MAAIRLRYLKTFTDRHGKVRHYFRRPGFPQRPLPGEPGSKSFMDAYHAAFDDAPRQIGANRAKPGSFAWGVVAYYESAAYGALAPITRATYRNALERLRTAFGHVSLADFTPKYVDELLDATPKNRETIRKVLRLVFKLAYRREVMRANPLEGLRMPRKAVAGHRAWSEADIAQYEARWPTGSRERLALTLLLYTAQRRDDVRVMGRQHLQGRVMKVTQHKTGTELAIPVHLKLKTELDQIPSDQLTFLLTQYGQPFSAAGFTQWFVERAQEAGCPKGCTPHGLRKAACRRLAEAGATPHQIMMISGHQNLAEVTLYTRAADQARLAVEAMALIEPGTEMSNPLKPVRQNGRKP